MSELLVLKVNACLEAKFIKQVVVQNTDHENKQNNSEIKEEVMSYFFQIKNEKIVASTQLNKWFANHIVDPIHKKMSEFQSQGSGWTLSEIVELCINNNKYVCFNGSSYVPLPTEVNNKKAVINIRNNDEKCFVWSVLAALHNKTVKKNPQRVSQYRKFLHDLDLSGILFPVTLNQIKNFEKNNSTISINVYLWEDEKNPETDEYEKTIVPVRLTKQTKENHIHLLLLYSNEEDHEEKKNFVELLDKVECKTHYCWIKDLSKLINSNISKHKGKLYVCDRCLHFFLHRTEFK